MNHLVLPDMSAWMVKYFGRTVTFLQNKDDQMKSLFAKTDKSIFVKLRYLRFKLLKYNGNNKNISDTFDHNFKSNPWYVMSEASF